MKAVVVGDSEETGDDGAGPDDAEDGQTGVPHHKHPSQVVGGPLLHPPPARKDERHVDHAGVDGYGPVILSPFLGFVNGKAVFHSF